MAKALKIWEVKLNHDRTFKKAYLNNNEMNYKKVEGDNDYAVDTEKMDKDFDDHPNIDGGGVKGNTYAYCLPLRNAANRIIGWTCYGVGPYTCPCP